MIRTKYVTLKVVCHVCSEDQFMVIKNFDLLPCDVCGKVQTRVTFEEINKKESTANMTNNGSWTEECNKFIKKEE